MSKHTLRHASIRPAHPGELLREIVVPATNLSKSEVARLLGISRQHLYDIMAGRKPVTPDTAIRLGKLFGDGPAVWARMQTEHDLWEAARRVDVSAMPTIRAA
jgi:addiction module HigA family antidote